MKKNKISKFISSNEKVESALTILQNLYIDIGLTLRTFKESESMVINYYMNYPNAKIKPVTLIGCIVYLISSRNNEYISLSLIAKKLEISYSWLAKKKKELAPDLGFSDSSLGGFT